MSCNASRGIRTPDRPLRRRMLYPAELWTHVTDRTSRFLKQNRLKPASLREQKLDMFHYRKSPGACQTFF